MYKTGILTLSDLGAKGLRQDQSGPLIETILKSLGHYDLLERAILADDLDAIKTRLIHWSDQQKLDLILTTGGTGFSPRDVTPEATQAVCDRMAPGIAEAMRYHSLQITPKAMLSRATAGLRGQTLIINLPGSPKAVKENLDAILPALDHGLKMLLGTGSANCATV